MPAPKNVPTATDVEIPTINPALTLVLKIERKFIKPLFCKKIIMAKKGVHPPPPEKGEEERVKLFSWHHGDPALVYFWLAFVGYLPIVAVFHTTSLQLKVSGEVYRRGFNMILFTPLLLVTAWRWGRYRSVPFFYVMPVLFSSILFVYYYLLKREGMYFESLSIAFLIFIPLSFVWKYVPKRVGRTQRRRLPSSIKPVIK